MNKEIPKIYVNKIGKIHNNDEVYYSYKDISNDTEEVIPSEYDIQNKIDELFRAKDFIYKKKFFIKTKFGAGVYTIISKSYDYLLTIDGEKIYIHNIIEIK